MTTPETDSSRDQGGGLSAEAAAILERAANLIEPEGAWTQGSYARDMFGSAAHFDNPSAECWCLIGAVCLSGGGEKVLTHLASSLGDYVAADLATWNDQTERTQAEVVSALRSAALALSTNPTQGSVGGAG